MKTKRWQVLIPVLIALFVIIALSFTPGSARADEGNSGGQEGLVALTPVPAAVGAEQLEIQITNAYLDQDYTPKFHIAGTITNNSSAVYGGLRITIQATDASGKSVMVDYSGNSMDSDDFMLFESFIWAGETQPFDIDFYTSETPADYSVVVTDLYETSLSYQKANVLAQNLLIQDLGDGYLYLSGELVNQESTWVRVDTLVGTLLDENGTLLAAASMYAYRTSLAPAGDDLGRDITPFFVQILTPGAEVTSGGVYFYPYLEDAPSVWLDTELTNTYYDYLGYYHVVGWLTNNSAEPWITDSVVSGFYNQDGMVVNVGWDYEFNDYLEPGARVPFDAYVIHDVGPGLDSASISRMTVMCDGFRSSYLDALVYVTLSNSEELISKDGSSWTVTGTVTNTSGLNLRAGDITTMIFDDQGNLVAVDRDGIRHEGDRFYPNDTVTYEIRIDLDPTADTSGYTSQTTVQAWYGINDEQGNAGYRPSGPLTPEITTYIPRPSDISTEPKVLGGNLFLAALIMLPFAVAAELFTRTLGKKEGTFKPLALLNRFTDFMEKKTSSTLRHPKIMDVVKLLGVLFFYGLTFSLLEPGWKPFTSEGISLFVYMTIAYGVVGLADDFIQWRTLRKWGQRADLAVRSTNLLIAVFSVAVSRIFHLLPGLLFGTPEALRADEETLDSDKRGRLLRMSAVTAGVLILVFWLPTLGTGLLLKSSLNSTLADVLSGIEAFLLVIFAVALENTFVKMLGFSGGFGQALRKKNRWLWVIAMIGVAFLFLHTLLNPLGNLSEAIEEGKVLLFVIASSAFMVFAFIIWLIYGRERKPVPAQAAVLPPLPTAQSLPPQASEAEVKPVPVAPIPLAPVPLTPTPTAPPAHPAPPRLPTQEVKGPPPLKAESPAVKLPPLPISETKVNPTAIPPLPAANRTCPSCGTSNPPDAKFCANCGAKLG